MHNGSVPALRDVILSLGGDFSESSNCQSWIGPWLGPKASQEVFGGKKGLLSPDSYQITFLGCPAPTVVTISITVCAVLLKKGQNIFKSLKVSILHGLLSMESIIAQWVSGEFISGSLLCGFSSQCICKQRLTVI